MSGTLKGLRVLDLTRVLAGPWATQMLADFGADVIKIEKPGEGDDTRGWGPPFLTNPDGSRGDAAYFQSANRGKQSVCIDMATPQGQELLRKLAAQAHGEALSQVMGAWEKREVELGLVSNTHAAIRGGVKPGEVVALEPPIAAPPPTAAS